MIWLALSILCSSTILLILKKVGAQKNGFNIIVINYLVCAILGLCLLGDVAWITQSVSQNYFELAVFLGCLFILIFFVMSQSADKAGVAVTAIANKLSLIIPVGIAFVFWGEAFTLIKMLGIVIALLALVLVMKKDKVSGKLKLEEYSLPMIVFLGSGIIDTSIKYAQANYISTSIAYNHFLVLLFGVAGFFGAMALIVKYIKSKKYSIERDDIIWGVMLGIPNYGSIYFLIKTLEQFDSSVIFPVNNIGIVVMSALGAKLFFKETLSTLNLLGIALALLSILLLTIL